MQPGICTVGNFLSPHGHTPQICESLAENFSKEGHSVVRAGKAHSRGIRAVEMASLLTLHRNRYQVALIDTFSGAAFQWARLSGLAARLAGRPYIAILHGGNLPMFYKTKSGAVEKYLTGAAGLVAPSPYLQRWAQSLGHSAEVIPNPLEILQFSYHTRKAHRLKLLWFRRFHAIYNPAMAIKTVSHLKKHFPQVRLVMAGPDGGELENCRRLARQLSLAREISFRGRLSKEEINLEGTDSDIFINTANIDNAPVSVVEAAAMGLPIVSTRVGGIPDLFSDGREILLSPAGDPKAMAERIIGVIEAPADAEKMTRQARDKAMDWTWNRVYPKWRNLFQRMGFRQLEA